MANKSKPKGTSRPLRPRQSQRRPGQQSSMIPRPRTLSSRYRGSGKLKHKVAIVTGGDSGIGRSIAVMFAREGADVTVAYLSETRDARLTQKLVAAERRECLLIRGDLSRPAFCRRVVARTIKRFGSLGVLVNNAAVQFPAADIREIRDDQLAQTFRINLFSMFYLVQAAVPYLELHADSSIINTASVTAYRGSPQLLDYSASKGAIVSFTRSLSQNLVDRKIRVNAVAPGPIWTPLIPATFDAGKVSRFGSDSPLGRAGEPDECASCFVFLASSDSSFMTGQVLHPNGGEIING